jgi:hypothetical protein
MHEAALLALVQRDHLAEGTLYLMGISRLGPGCRHGAEVASLTQTLVVTDPWRSEITKRSLKEVLNGERSSKKLKEPPPPVYF